MWPVTLLEDQLLSAFGLKKLKHTWHPWRCPKCSGTGYAGRIGVHEVLPITEGVVDLISSCAAPEAIRAAVPSGFRPIQQDALHRVAEGQTSLAEVRRIIYLDILQKAESCPRASPLRVKSGAPCYHLARDHEGIPKSTRLSSQYGRE